MHSWLTGAVAGLAAGQADAWWYTGLMVLKVAIGFSIIIFVHELGHFLAAKWVGVRVDRFAVGFGPRLFGWRRGEGLTLGNRPNYRPQELARKRYGETDYCFKALPIGGYVKMLGQDDIVIDEKTGQMQMSDDPRAFTNRPVGQRMTIASAGVVFNLLFAALLITCVFMLGKAMEAPVVGEVLPDSPARGKLLTGDRILAVNGQEVHSFKDVFVATILADGPLRLKVARGGKPLEREVVIRPVTDPQEQLPTLGITPLVTTTRTSDGLPVGELPNVKAGDQIVAVDGQPVESAPEVIAAFARSGGRVLEVTVRRPDGQGRGARTVRCYQRAQLFVQPADPPAARRGHLVDNCHILGMQRRRVVGYVKPGSPAEQAGFQVGDVILEWGTVANPLFEEIIASIRANPGRQIPVLVRRGGSRVRLLVTPRRPFSLRGGAEPKVGLDLHSRAEQASAVVARVAPGTPAAALGLPRGAVIRAIDGKPVADWFELAAALQAAAGRTVAARYRSGGDESVGQMFVPESIVNALRLGPTGKIWQIDGQKTVRIADEQGKQRELSLPDVWAVRELLARKVGQTVAVVFSREYDSPRQTGRFAVRADNVDPWQLRLVYVYDLRGFGVKKELIRTSNPLKALWMGTQVVGYKVLEVYQFIRGLATRNVGVRHVAGPVGILKFAVERAKLGLAELLFFLGFLSVNLAVLNFLPLPVLDGGLMVFLLIEKIKGRPLSLKTQMISTIIGLTTIIIVGLLVTFQDISRFFG